MPRILIVDDDHTQVKALARILSMRRRDLTVLTASHGLDAIEVLQAGPVDLVLTDLQMPEMNGFELMAWLVRNQPHVPLYSMTAYPTKTDDRFDELGHIECFTKPLDITVLLDRVSQVLAAPTRGHVTNIGLPSFLQLLEMEKKTCVLTVQSGGETGFLYLESGSLIHAKCRDLEGVEAATSIVGWREPMITITSATSTPTRTLDLPIGFVIMEAMRRQDEEMRVSSPPSSIPPTPESVASSSHPPGAAKHVSSAPPREEPPRRSLSHFPSYLPLDARAVALVEVSTGRIRNAAGSFARLDAHAELIAQLYRSELVAIERLALDDDIEELLVTTPEHWTLARPVDARLGTLVVLVFDPLQVSVVLERRVLASFVSEIEAWCAQQT